MQAVVQPNRAGYTTLLSTVEYLRTLNTGLHQLCHSVHQHSRVSPTKPCGKDHQHSQRSAFVMYVYLSIVLSEGLSGYRWWRAVRTPCLLRGLHFVHSRVDVASYFFFLGGTRGRKIVTVADLVIQKGGCKSMARYLHLVCHAHFWSHDYVQCARLHYDGTVKIDYSLILRRNVLMRKN